MGAAFVSSSARGSVACNRSGLHVAKVCPRDGIRERLQPRASRGVRQKCPFGCVRMGTDSDGSMMMEKGDDAVNLLDYGSVYEALKDVQVRPCGAVDEGAEKQQTGWSIPLTSVMNAVGRRTLLCLFTHFGDLTTFEYAQRLLPELQLLEEKNVNLVCVGIGSPENARLFAELTGFPISYVYADETAAAYDALNLYKGFLGDQEQVHPYVKLFAMLAGIGSPGTMRRVLGGYFGSRDRSIEKWAKGAIKFLDASMFDVLGSQYQRPFELATVRLQNMIDIIPRWFQLTPEKQELITRQGATIVLDAAEQRVLYAYRDSGILVYADVDYALSCACQPAKLTETLKD